MQRTFLAVVLTAMLLCAGCAAEQSQGQSSSNADISSGQEQQDSFDQLEQALTMYEPGAAGSSKKVYIAAAGILNYSMEYELNTQDTLEEWLRSFYQEQEKAVLEQISNGLGDVKMAAAEILMGGEAMDALLEEAGNPQKYQEYENERYLQVIACVENVLREFVPEK